MPKIFVFVNKVDNFVDNRFNFIFPYNYIQIQKEEDNHMPKKLTLRGRVQGVGCRQYCKAYAEDLGI
ncbi:MAG: acylphosphatase, partial [Leptospirales bacterium]|nr:acylphosphatase [Leptospirales bacterium]